MQDTEKPLEYSSRIQVIMKKMLSSFPGAQINTSIFNQKHRVDIQESYEAFDIMAVSKCEFFNK